MAKLIEVVCENCGKLLRVPKSRQGQTGKCAKCKAPVTIPIQDDGNELRVITASSKSQAIASQGSASPQDPTKILASPANISQADELITPSSPMSDMEKALATPYLAKEQASFSTGPIFVFSTL